MLKALYTDEGIPLVNMRRLWRTQNNPDCHAVSMSPSGRWVAYRTKGELLLISGQDGNCLKRLPIQGDPGDPQFSRDEKRILLGGMADQSGLRELLLETFGWTAVRRSPESSITDAAYLGDEGNIVAAAMLEYRSLGEVSGSEVWQGGQRRLEHWIAGEDRPRSVVDSALEDVRFLKTDRTGTRILVAGYRGEGEALESFHPDPLRRIGGFPGSEGDLGYFALSDDGVLVAGASFGAESVRVWEVEGRRLLYELVPRGPIDGISFIRGSETVVIAHTSAVLSLYAGRSGHHLQDIRLEDAPTDMLAGAADVPRLVTVAETGAVSAWMLES